MDMPEFIQVKFIGSPETIEKLAVEFKNSPEQVKVLSSDRQQDPTSLQFGLMEWAALIAIVQGVFYLGELSIKLHDYLTSDKEKKTQIIIQTPLGRMELMSSANFSEAEIRDALIKLVKIHK